MLLRVSSEFLLTTIKYDINLDMLSTLKIHSLSLTRLDGRFFFLVTQLLSSAYDSHVLPNRLEEECARICKEEFLSILRYYSGKGDNAKKPTLFKRSMYNFLCRLSLVSHDADLDGAIVVRVSYSIAHPGARRTAERQLKDCYRGCVTSPTGFGSLKTRPQRQRRTGLVSLFQQGCGTWGRARFPRSSPGLHG
jgi:hypothetical protein